MSSHERWSYCTRCDRWIRPGNEVWLDLDTRTNTYTDQEVLAKYSQGGFPFGPDCAKILLRQDKIARGVAA